MDQRPECLIGATFVMNFGADNFRSMSQHRLSWLNLMHRRDMSHKGVQIALDQLKAALAWPSGGRSVKARWATTAQKTCPDTHVSCIRSMNVIVDDAMARLSILQCPSMRFITTHTWTLHFV